jgi:hypothetical protein
MRTKYWLIKGRREIKRVIQSCDCFKLRARRFLAPMMAPLPHVRTNPSFAFTHVGMDFAGPFKVMVKMTKSSKECPYWQNVYVLILTCLVTRAMHFEYTYTQETNHTVNALMRFIARRVHCVAIYCDNGRSFLKADWELKNCINHWTGQ